MLRDVLFQRLILGTLVLLGCIIAVGIVYLKRIESQAQSEIAKITKQVQPLKETAAETHPASATDSRHYPADATWHAESHNTPQASEDTTETEDGDGDTWYPENYTQADIEADIAGRDAMTDEEYERRTTKHAVNHYIQKHREKHPDCAEHTAVLADAKRYAEWVLADQIYRDKNDELKAEFDRIAEEMEQLFEKYNNRPFHESTHIPESERIRDLARMKTFMAQLQDQDKRTNALKREKPIYPKPHHTH